jgi:adenosylcobinamide-GDP ribazoletransferase
LPPLRPPGFLRDLAGAWIYYSVLPAWPLPTPRFERIARFAPWIGAVLGGLQGLLWWALEGRAPLLAQVALVLALGLWLTGGLHMDGAMDTADGLAAGGDRALEAMADSRVGASGVIALAQLLLLRGGALALLGPLSPAALLCAAFWGRVAPMVAIGRYPYLRPGGRGAFHRRHWAGWERENWPTVILAGVLLGLPHKIGWPPGLWPPVVLGMPPALIVPRWLGRRLGGHTGDSYGACVEWTESLTLLLLAVIALAFRSGAAG